jgi:hypothetical protein
MIVAITLLNVSHFPRFPTKIFFKRRGNRGTSIPYKNIFLKGGVIEEPRFSTKIFFKRRGNRGTSVPYKNIFLKGGVIEEPRFPTKIFF